MRIGPATLIVALLALSSLSILVPAHGASSPSIGGPVASGPDLISPSAPVASHGTPLAFVPQARSASSAASSPSASCVPNWNSVNFFQDVCVSFSLVGSSTPPNIPTVPLVGNISMYVPAFFLNITTNVPITAASVYIWATQWPQAGTIPQAVTGFDPSGWNTSDVHAMVLCNNKHAGCATPSPDSATFKFDLNKYFFPGTNISFMVEVISAAGSPTSTIWSYKTLNVTEPYPSGYVTYPTWEVDVQSPFASPIFENDIKISTIPSVLTKPAYLPNPTQKVQIIISSFSLTAGTPTPIPYAFCQYSVNTKLQGGGTESITGSANFGPPNSTVMTLGTPIQPQLGGTLVIFNVTAGLLWAGTQTIDKIVSRNYNFTFLSGGGWPQPSASLESNANITSVPFVLNPSALTYLPTGTRVNVTVHERLENVTITSSEIDYKFTDHGASLSGSVPMDLVNQNTSSVVLPGLPPDSSLSYQVITKDVNGNPAFSGRYSYVENGTPVPPVADGKGYFFVEVYDVARNTLVPGVTYTMANLSWVQNTSTSRFGFGALYNFGSTDYLELSYGSYVLTLHVFGSTIQRPIGVSSPMPYTVVFYVSSGSYPLPTSSPAPATLAAAGVIGLAAAFFAYFPIMAWFKERRAKAEEEQRRITL